MRVVLTFLEFFWKGNITFMLILAIKPHRWVIRQTLGNLALRRPCTVPFSPLLLPAQSFFLCSALIRFPVHGLGYLIATDD